MTASPAREIVVGLFFMKGQNFTPCAPHGVLPSITGAAALTLWAFIGLESATVPAEEVKDPERTIPRATILGTLLATRRLHHRHRGDHGHHPQR
jgi:basic amino acid/polyamine antiporter, APA family